MFNPILDAFGDNQGAYDDAYNAFNQQAQRYNPWIERGNRASDLAFQQYQQNAQNPTFQQDAIARHWQQSPFQTQLSDALTKRMNMNAANSGMIMSPVAQDALNKQLNTQTGQFQQDYVNQGLDQYNKSLGGLSQIGQSGLTALDSQGNLITQGIGARLGGSISHNNAINRLLGTGANLAMAYAPSMMSGGFTSPGGTNYMNTPNMSYGAYSPPSSSSTFNIGGY